MQTWHNIKQIVISVMYVSVCSLSANRCTMLLCLSESQTILMFMLGYILHISSSFVLHVVATAACCTPVCTLAHRLHHRVHLLCDYLRRHCSTEVLASQLLLCLCSYLPLFNYQRCANLQNCEYIELVKF